MRKSEKQNLYRTLSESIQCTGKQHGTWITPGKTKWNQIGYVLISRERENEYRILGHIGAQAASVADHHLLIAKPAIKITKNIQKRGVKRKTGMELQEFNRNEKKENYTENLQVRK